MSDAALITKLKHPQWGRCDLVRIEDSDWIIRFHCDGKLYRFPPTARSHFVKEEDSVRVPPTTPTALPPAAPTVTPPPPRTPVKPGLATVQHPTFGVAELVRIEVSDWIVRQANGQTYRYRPAGRNNFVVLEDRTPDKRFSVRPKPAAAPISPVITPPPEVKPAPIEIAIDVAPIQTKVMEPDTHTVVATEDKQPPATVAVVQPQSTNSAARQRAFRVIEALRIGLPPLDVEARSLAVGFESISTHIQNLLDDVGNEGGRAMVVRGIYGQGKTFALKLMEETALENGFMVVRTEIDATENRLNKPHHIYRDLMAHLRVPGFSGDSVRTLIRLATGQIQSATHRISDNYQLAWAGRSILQKELDCMPLAWLLSDPGILKKPDLVGLLKCDPEVQIAATRRCHEIPGQPRDWVAFTAGTQGDFASYLLHGLGRLARYVGFKGLIVILDEMEKWQDLNWKEQSQAGNLLGGLIWGATAELGKRGERDNPPAIEHSGRVGGYPFTTKPRSHVGIAIAMTPRGQDSPEQLWNEYGLLEMAYLPELTDQKLATYCQKVAPHFYTAYGIDPSQNGHLPAISGRAVQIWKQRGELNTRSGVQAAIEAFDEWREKSDVGAS